MPREPIVGPGSGAVTAADPERRQRDEALRPRLLDEVIGQKAVVDRLRIALNACRKLREPMCHILFDGPPGLGKTTFATVLPNELDAPVQITSGPALTRPADLLPYLTNAKEGSFLFIDEIHRTPRIVEEFIYSAMEDFRVGIPIGEGLNARTMWMKLNRFTLIGATTRSGMLTGPMRDRFKHHEHLDFYTAEELAKIVAINAQKLSTPIEPAAALEIARRSRGTPRIANARLWWARNYAASEHDGAITLDVARAALAMAEIDAEGLDKQDRRYLETLLGVFGGGPTGVESLAATMNLAADTLGDEVEPYLLRAQFIVRSPRGRIATPKAASHLNLPLPPPVTNKKQTGPTLFDPIDPS
ncbi:MAG TPA: Holliday junction branch migration DNA helicase RuvB [Gemmatales bacterium]|nr:Holliday junction branch migration DNA helicase RuvB [Gemmatales bacterium]